MLLSPPALHFPRDETSRSDYTRKDVPNIGCTAFIRNTFGNGNKIVVFENAEVEVAALMLRVRSGPPFTKRSGDMVYTMPWKERSVVEERMRFVLWLKGGTMASLCRDRHLSGHRCKIFKRYKECGREGLTDRARTPYRYANKFPPARKRHRFLPKVSEVLVFSFLDDPTRLLDTELPTPGG